MPGVAIIDAAARRARDLGAPVDGGLTWDGSDEHGLPVGTGVYFVRSGRFDAGKVIVVP